MPELPEMETYRRLLTERVAAGTITHVEVNREKSINLPVPAFIADVQGAGVTSIERRAKHLLFHLHHGKLLLLHLMLGGFMYYGSEQDRLERTAQVVLGFQEKRLFFHGLRLGYLHLLSEEHAAGELAHLGPEPLAADFSEQLFRELAAKKKGMLKTALVDQRFLAGIGNCYSDEICFAAGILPMRQIQELGVLQISRLYQSIREVLTEAVRYGGYMERPLFQGDRLTGGYDERCKVYDRESEPCVRCGNPIVRDEISSRKTFYCKICQS